MMKKSNILALVGGGKRPKFSNNKITIWDDHQGLIMSQIRFNSEIIKVKIREDTLIGILIDKIYVLDINTLEIVNIFETFNNPNGIFAMSYNLTDFYISFPHPKHKGKVQIENYIMSKGIHNKNDSKEIQAHESNISYITMNNEGTLLVTTSDKGTIIRLFNIITKEKITELRRGKKNVKINCLAIDINTEFIGCTSDVGTVHIFDIQEVNKVIGKNEEINEENDDNEKNDKNDKNDKNKIAKPIKVKIPDRSFGKFRIKEEKSILGINPKNFFVVLTSNGKLYKAFFDTKYGVYNNKTEESFIEVENN